MGAVAMKVVDSWLSRGYPHLTYAVYVYCDRCGSFNIRRRLSRRQWGLLTGWFSLAAAMLTLKVVPLLATPSWSADWLCISLVLLLFAGGLAYNFWGFPAYQCRKCGRFTTWRYNTRHASSDMSLVDVPDHLTQKYSLEGWPDLEDIESYLKPPAQFEHERQSTDDRT